MVGALLFTGEGGGSWGRKGGKRIDPDGAWLTADEAVTRDETRRVESRRDGTRRYSRTDRHTLRTYERTNGATPLLRSSLLPARFEGGRGVGVYEAATRNSRFGDERKRDVDREDEEEGGRTEDGGPRSREGNSRDTAYFPFGAFSLRNSS